MWRYLSLLTKTTLMWSTPQPNRQYCLTSPRHGTCKLPKGPVLLQQGACHRTLLRHVAPVQTPHNLQVKEVTTTSITANIKIKVIMDHLRRGHAHGSAVDDEREALVDVDCRRGWHHDLWRSAASLVLMLIAHCAHYIVINVSALSSWS